MACLDEEDVKAMTQCSKLKTDCADVCRITASLLSRGSEHGKHLLKECAEIWNPVRKNLKSILTWSIVENALKYAIIAPTSVAQ